MSMCGRDEPTLDVLAETDDKRVMITGRDR
jgi:hypothetical protein